MEIKRKKITNEKIYETEQKLIGEITELCNAKRPMFEALGYDLELILGQKENDAQRAYAPYRADESATFDAGYISHALINVKRPKNQEELAEDARAEQANREMLEAAETEEEIQDLEDAETVRIADDNNRRLIAFTELMIARTYKSFWTDWVSLGDGIHEIEEDLEEFYEKLLAKSQNA